MAQLTKEGLEAIQARAQRQTAGVIEGGVIEGIHAISDRHVLLAEVRRLHQLEADCTDQTYAAAEYDQIVALLDGIQVENPRPMREWMDGITLALEGADIAGAV